MQRESSFGNPIGFVRSVLLGHHTADRWRGLGGVDRPAGFVLGRLAEGWELVALHDDGHVVVGPGGTFALHTSRLEGKVWVSPTSVRHNGHPTRLVTTAAHTARRTSDLLSRALGQPVAVRGALVIIADSWTITDRPTEVFVGAPRGVRDWLLRQPAVLGERDIAAIAGVTRARSSWLAQAVSA